MHILVLVKMVPDTVEELEVGSDGTSLDPEFLRPIISERDEHALEQALLLKDRGGATVTALALDSPEVDDVLFTALAKGCDRVVKVTGAELPPGTSVAADVLANVVLDLHAATPVDLVLTGCWAIDDLDGMLGPTLAERMGVPYLGIVTGVAIAAGTSRVRVLKEYAGGVHGAYGVCLPVVLGIQAAEQPPRYVPVAKVRAAMKSGKIETVTAPAMERVSPLAIVRMTKPEVAGRAEMLDGSPEEVGVRVAELLSARGLL